MIKVIFTGGTIGSVRVPSKDGKGFEIMQPSEARERGYDAKNCESLLLGKFKDKYKGYDASFKSSTPYEVLSEKMTINQWNKLIEELKNIDFSKCEGVIITHGTDTLGYTANLVSMLLDHVSVPVVLVSSNYQLEDNRANGLTNFKAAVDFIKNEGFPGVYVTYNTDPKELKTKIIYGSRILQCKAPTDDFDSISYNSNTPLGYINSKGFLSVADRTLYDELNYTTQDDDKNLIKKLNKLKSEILLIEPYVGLNYNYFKLSENTESNPNAILHTLYHSGTACVSPQNEIKDIITKNDIINLARQAKRLNVGFYAGPIYGAEGRDLYATSSEMNQENIRFIMNTSKENAYIKLLLAYSLIDKDSHDSIEKQVNTFLEKNINREYISSGKVLKRTQ